jgi:hypothetical protein
MAKSSAAGLSDDDDGAVTRAFRAVFLRHKDSSDEAADVNSCPPQQ